jgi:hypothetical protein
MMSPSDLRQSHLQISEHSHSDLTQAAAYFFSALSATSTILADNDDQKTVTACRVQTLERHRSQFRINFFGFIAQWSPLFKIWHLAWVFVMVREPQITTVSSPNCKYLETWRKITFCDLFQNFRSQIYERVKSSSFPNEVLFHHVLRA